MHAKIQNNHIKSRNPVNNGTLLKGATAWSPHAKRIKKSKNIFLMLKKAREQNLIRANIQFYFNMRITEKFSSAEE